MARPNVEGWDCPFPPFNVKFVNSVSKRNFIISVSIHIFRSARELTYTMCNTLLKYENNLICIDSINSVN